MIKRVSLLTFAACIACSAASAATFNFEQDADDFFDEVIAGKTAYEGTFDQVYGLAAVDIDGRAATSGTAGRNTNGGITLTASATKAAGAAADPFMDSNDAGLGVCSNGFQTSGKSKCSTNVGPNQGDDNLVTPEILKLEFDFSVLIDDLFIRDAKHKKIISRTDAISINGDFYDTDANGYVILTGLSSASSFLFTSNGDDEDQDEIYLSVLEASKVPVPASLPLLAGGLGVAGWFARRRKKS